MERNSLLRLLLPCLVMAAVALFQTSTARAAACEPPPVELCANAPTAQANHCRTLASYLADFQQEVCSLDLADPAFKPGYAAVVSRANGNLGPSLLTPGSVDRVAQEIDALAALGATVIRLDIVYPLLTPAFHTYLASQDGAYTHTAKEYLAFYRSVVEVVRARGLQVHIEHSNLLPAYTSLNPMPYYATMKAQGEQAVRERFRQERAEEARLLLTELSPDYLTLVSEPDTSNNAFGLVNGAPLYSPAQWQEYVEYAVSRFPAHTTRVGAGAGTWDSDDYIRRFAALPALDYVDMHVYPARSPYRNYLSDLLTRSDLVRSIDPNKGITIGEAWLYKADAAEIAGFQLTNVELFGRDAFSYWEPLDVAFIELLDQAARAKQIEVLTPFWSRYFFAYLDYNATSSLPPVERMIAASTEGFKQMQAGTLTNTGRAFRNLASGGDPLVLGSLQPNHGPQTGPGAAQTVTLSGANFSLESAPTILFGGAAATSVEVVDAATLRAVVPAGSGTVTVTVISADGRRASKANGYTYDAPPSLLRISPTQGPETGGTLVVLEGSNFSMGDAPAQVFFGEVAATDVTVYGNRISARAPQGVGLGQVVVKVLNRDGQSALLPAAYRYIPKPQVVSLSPATGPSSGSTSVTIHGQNFMPNTPGTRVLIGGVDATQVTVVDASTIQAVTPPGMGTLKVIVINPDMQTGELANAFAYVNPPFVQDVVPFEGVPAGGNEVWITGARFAADAQVFFGTVQATIKSRSANVLKVIAPGGSGAAPIRVVNPDGQAGQAARSYTYSNQPAPAVLFFDPSHIPTSGGIKVFIFGQNFNSRATVHFGSTAALNVRVINSTWIQVTAPVGQGSVNIRVTNPDGKQALSLLPMNFSNTGPVTGTAPGDVLGIGEEIEFPVDLPPLRFFLPAVIR